jgi:pimeloyl-ACP methyl ester carboxylesterase/ribosomal protein S18 acetylase RimI-like enzyme
MDKLPVDIATAERPVPTIVEATPEHHPAIRQLLREAYSGYAAPMPAEVFPVYLADVLDITAEDATLLVAVEDGAVVGTARVQLRPTAVGLPAGAAYVRGVAVRPDRAGTGVARALMASCTDRARAAGADSMWLHTAPFMRPAIRLYEGLGYRRVPAYDTDSRRHYGLASDPLLHAFAYRLDLSTFVEVGDGYRLWVQTTGADDLPPLLLVMGANACGLGWPDALVDRLAQHHRVVRYDHRDTGRSTRAYAERPYAIRDLADDAIAVLDALGIERAHVVGMSLGGTLVQLLLLDHPDRLLSATLWGTSLLGGAPPDPEIRDEDLPGPDPRLLALWAELGEERDDAAELAWRVEHWRILNGDVLPFDADEFRRLEERVAEHSGTWANPAAHALADQSGLERGAELARVRVPTLVVDAPADPVVPPPHAARLARAIPGARLLAVDGLGHALGHPVRKPLADAILEHTGRTGADGR